MNTSGGNLGEAYIHGMENVNEAVRQVRGESTCQVADVELSLSVSGPGLRARQRRAVRAAVSEPTDAARARCRRAGPCRSSTPFNRDWFTTGELAVQKCEACGTLQHPPEEICHVCGSMAFTTTVLPGTGTVYSFTVVHHSVHAALDAAVPYAVVLVSLDAAPDLRVVGNLLDGRGARRRHRDAGDGNLGGADRRRRQRRCCCRSGDTRRRSEPMSTPGDGQERVEARDARRRGLDAHRPAGRPEQVLHGVGRLPRHRVAGSSSSGSTTATATASRTSRSATTAPSSSSPRATARRW